MKRYTQIKLYIYTVQSLYNTPCYSTDFDIHSHVAPIFYHEILQRNYRKMTTPWSFSYNSVVKLALHIMILLQHGSFLWTPNIAL